MCKIDLFEKYRAENEFEEKWFSKSCVKQMYNIILIFETKTEITMDFIKNMKISRVCYMYL